MRPAGDAVRGARMRAFIALLWRGGLRITEAFTVTEHDLDPRPGAMLVRHGKGGPRREVDMDRWAGSTSSRGSSSGWRCRSARCCA